MRDDLNIKEANWESHLDIEKDIQKRMNGIFTFTLRIYDGKVSDYNVVKYVDVRQKYLRRFTLEELTISQYIRKGN